jgi:hypothetical protein
MPLIHASDMLHKGVVIFSHSLRFSFDSSSYMFLCSVKSVKKITGIDFFCTKTDCGCVAIRLETEK